MSAALIGALAAVVVVAGVVAIAASGVLPTREDTGSGKDGPVAVALVLPGSDGAVALRALDVYTLEGSGWSVRSVAPSSVVVVSGTGGSILADAYSFGGGPKLAETLRSQLDQPVSAWLIVDEAEWLSLRSGSSVPVDLPKAIDVFDGKSLSSFAEGQGSVLPSQTGLLLDGSAYLNPLDGKIVRTQVGDALASSLASVGPSGGAGVQSSLSASALSAWMKALGRARRVPGT